MQGQTTPVQRKITMILKIKDWLNENKVSVALVGAAIVITTQWGQCSYDPSVKPVEDVQEGAQDAVP